MAPESMQRVNWTITKRQHQELKRRSRETGLPISELVRRALDRYLGLAGEADAADPSEDASGGTEPEGKETSP